MKELTIRRPEVNEREMIYRFFELVIRDTFEHNGIFDLTETLNEEIEDKRRCLEEDFISYGRDRYFLVAILEDQLVGTIEYGISNDLIKECTKGELSHLMEIGTVYVHPEHQKKGISHQLWTKILQIMKDSGIEECCFDSGYPIAQKIWWKKYGEPTYHLKNYWDEGADHMVWRLKIEDVL